MGTRGAISNKYVSLLLIFVQRRLANGARRIRRSLSIANDALRTYSSTSTCGREGVEVWQHCWPLYDSRIGRAFCEPELKGSLSQKNWNCSDPLFSGLPESIFHADPHAGNLMVQTQKTCPIHARASGLEPGGPHRAGIRSRAERREAERPR